MKTILIPKIVLLLLCLGLTGPGLQAQFGITGNVALGEDLEPVPDYEVNIYLPVHDQQYSVFTDAKGNYQAVFDWTSAEVLLVRVDVIDLCTGAIHSVRLPDDAGNYVADFRLCQGIDPPPPPSGCQSYFAYEQLRVNPPTVLFFDLSYHSGAEISYQWDFGDGSTVNVEPAPTHEFSETGVYQVSLTVKSEDCTSTSVQSVAVRDSLDCVCPAVYNPVCVTLDDGTQITFSNACEANCAGFSEGDWTSCEPNECGCPEFYDPVCVFSPAGDTLTFSNRCFAECAGYTPDQFYSCNPINECDCAPTDVPVCVRSDSGEILRFPSACLARCAGYPESAIVDCNDGCICPEYYDPVCVVDNGVTRTFDNECFARCAGYTEADYFKCEPKECNCSEEYSPVCVITDFGPAYWFLNACEAECAGFDADQYERCGPDDCICPDVYEPVCAINLQGDTLVFGNVCEAICAGFIDYDLFDCYQEPICDCDAVYDPVCIYTPGGGILRFDNPCEARCAGYDENAWVSCTDNYCQARFELADSEVGPLAFQFLNRSFPLDTMEVKWRWEFGDGTSSEARDPVHEYQQEGIYEVRLTVETPDGCTDTHREQLVVGMAPVDDCKAMFFFEQAPDDPYAFRFLDMSLGDIVAWNWYFGDGETSEEATPEHIYEEAGIYIVSLSVTAANGCTSLVSMLIATDDDIVYNPECHALFLPVMVSETNEVYFLNFSSQDVVATEWDFGDGTVGDILMPTHTYATSGSYNVTLTVFTESGCTNSYSATINLAGESFTATPAYSFLTTTDVEEPKLEPLSVRVFPNPVRTELWLDLSINSNGPVQWRVLNLNGQMVRQGQRELAAGQQRFAIETIDLPSGVYVVQLMSEEGMVTKKFVKDGGR